METDYPFTRLFREKLVPMMARGHTVGLSGSVFSFNVESGVYIETVGTEQLAQYDDPYILMRVMSQIICRGTVSEYVLLDSKQYMPYVDIDAFIPDLEINNDGVRYQSWSAGC